MKLESLSELTYLRGRVALYALLKGLGIGKEDQIAIQAFTCIAVPQGIMATGAIPLYVDIEDKGFNMCPEDLERKITPQTKAFIVQHTYGIPAKMTELIRISEAHKIPIIEDCCHTVDSRYQGQKVGSFGIGSFYSFGWAKPIPIGVGGSAVANNEQLTQKLIEEQA